jgi:cation transport regulator ChaB
MMPKIGKNGRAKKSELPTTLQKSPAKAQQTFAAAHDAAAEQYGDEGRAYRVAFSAVKHTFEKVGDRWEAKDEKGPSDERARIGGLDDSKGEAAEGVNASATKKHLLDVARRLDVAGRSKMTKDELVDAIMKANRRISAQRR